MKSIGNALALTATLAFIAYMVQHHRKRSLGMDDYAVLYVRNSGLEQLKGGNNGK